MRISDWSSDVCSSDLNVRAIAPVARRAGVTVISFSNDVSIAGNGVYLLGYNPADSINRVVRYAKAQGMTRFASLVPRGTYGERASTALLRGVEAAGGPVVSMQAFERSAGSITAAVKKLPRALGRASWRERGCPYG